MARRDPVGIRLITRKGQRLDTALSPGGRGCEPPKGALLPDRWRGGVLRCGGVTAFHLLRHPPERAAGVSVCLDLLELNGTDLRREPIEVRKATLASILRKARHGVRLNEHLEHPRVTLSSGRPARWGWRDPRSCMRWYARRSGKLGSSTIRLADRFHAFKARDFAVLAYHCAVSVETKTSRNPGPS